MKFQRGILHFFKSDRSIVVLILFVSLMTSLNTRAENSEKDSLFFIETGIILDTLNNSVVLVLDEKKNPLYYTSFVFTPVCAVGECYPIKINLFWTLAGSYLKYTLPVNEILTKVDHIHFTPEDYAKLDAILRTKNSTLNYLIYEPKVNDAAVDGITGATARASKRDYVEGAIYTSLTVYSLIHGEVVQKLKSFTHDQLISEDHLAFFLDHPDGEVAELAYRWLTTKMNSQELTTLILNRINTGKEKHSDVAVRFLKEENLIDSAIQKTLVDIYLQSKTPPATRTYLLELWADEQLITVTKTGILTGLVRYKNDFELIVQILAAQAIWEVEVYEKLVEAIKEENNMTRKTKLIGLLESRKKNAPASVKKYLKEIQKEMGL